MVKVDSLIVAAAAAHQLLLVQQQQQQAAIVVVGVIQLAALAFLPLNAHSSRATQAAAAAALILSGAHTQHTAHNTRLTATRTHSFFPQPANFSLQKQSERHKSSPLSMCSSSSSSSCSLRELFLALCELLLLLLSEQK